MSGRLGPREEPAFSGVFSGAFLSVLVLALLLAYVPRALRPGGWLAPDPEPRGVAPRSDLPPEELAVARLFDSASSSVVSIRSSQLRVARGQNRPQETPEDSGSGFVWDDSGLVVTNLHVVRGGTRFIARLKDGTAHRAEFVGAAPDYDLAVLRLETGSERLTPIPIGSSADLRVGQRSFAIGYPFGLEQTLTTGVVSGLDRVIQAVSGQYIHGVIQTDAAINPGNSGGPLLDSAGRLIGVNTAIATATGANSGVGFAIPVDTVNRIVPRILVEGLVERAGLGVFLAQDFFATEQGLEGAVIDSVVPGGAAERAGLGGMTEARGGELVLGDVIVGIGDQEVHREADLYQALEAYRAGDEVRVRFIRGSEETPPREVRVRLTPLR